MANDRLLRLIERVERLEDEKAEIATRISDVKKEAKACGYSVKAINEVLRLRRMKPDERAEFEALVDLYKADIGMLEGTPLGEFARKRLSGEQSQTEDETIDAFEDSPRPEKPKPEAIKAAREEGRKAAGEGKPVLENPYPAGDPRRAAWDEGWCQHKGSDGMDIPDEWKPSPRKPKQPPKTEKGDEE